AAVIVSPGGAHVYVAAKGDFNHDNNAVSIFRRDADSGALTFVDALFHAITTPTTFDGLSRPKSLAPTADGKFLYIGSFDQDVGVYSRDPASGALTFVQTTSFIPGGTNSVAVSPDGTLVYALSAGVSGDGMDLSALDVFTRDASTGMVAGVQRLTNGQGGVTGIGNRAGFASAVAASADGRHVYATGPSNNAIAVFSTGTVAVACTGDCDGNHAVTINELLLGVNIALGNQ